MKVIIYDNGSGGVEMIVPCDADKPVSETALMCVPEGQPFLIVDKAELPESQEYIDAWEADFSEPDGVGLGTTKYWLQKQEENAAFLYRKAAPEELYRIGKTN